MISVRTGLGSAKLLNLNSDRDVLFCSIDFLLDFDVSDEIDFFEEIMKVSLQIETNLIVDKVNQEKRIPFPLFKLVDQQASGNRIMRKYATEFRAEIKKNPMELILETDLSLRAIGNNSGHSDFSDLTTEDIKEIVDFKKSEDFLIESGLVSSSTFIYLDSFDNIWNGPIRQGENEAEFFSVEKVPVLLQREKVQNRKVQDYRFEFPKEKTKTERSKILKAISQVSEKAQESIKDVSFEVFSTFTNDGKFNLFVLLDRQSLDDFSQYSLGVSGKTKINSLDVFRKRKGIKFENNSSELMGTAKEEDFFLRKYVSDKFQMEEIPWKSPRYRLFLLSDMEVGSFNFGQYEYQIRLGLSVEQDKTLAQHFEAVSDWKRHLEFLRSFKENLPKEKKADAEKVELAFLVKARYLNSYLELLRKLNLDIDLDQFLNQLILFVDPLESTSDSLDFVLREISEVLSFVDEKFNVSIPGINLNDSVFVKRKSNLFEYEKTLDGFADSFEYSRAKKLGYFQENKLEEGRISLKEFENVLKDEILKYFPKENPEFQITMGEVEFTGVEQVNSKNLVNLTPAKLKIREKEVIFDLVSSDSQHQRLLNSGIREALELVEQEKIKENFNTLGLLEVEKGSTRIESLKTSETPEFDRNQLGFDTAPLVYLKESPSTSTEEEVKNGLMVEINSKSVVDSRTITPKPTDRSYFNAFRNNIFNQVGSDLQFKPPQVKAVVLSSIDPDQTRIDWQKTFNFETLYDNTVGKCITLQYFDPDDFSWKILFDKQSILARLGICLVRLFKLSDNASRIKFATQDYVLDGYFLLYKEDPKTKLRSFEIPGSSVDDLIGERSFPNREQLTQQTTVNEKIREFSETKTIKDVQPATYNLRRNAL